LRGPGWVPRLNSGAIPPPLAKICVVLLATGHIKPADAIAKRITRVQDRENNLKARLSKAEARCRTSSGNTDTTAG